MLLKWFICVLVVALVAGTWLWLGKRKRTQDPPASIVLLLTRPRHVDVHLLAELLSEVSGRTVRPIGVRDDQKSNDDNGGPVGDMVAGASPHFIAHVAGTAFAIHNLSEPYMKDPLRVSDSVPDLRIRKAIGDHTAWLSMDIVHAPAATNEAYRITARVLARLIGPDCVALYHPPLNRFVPCKAEETAEKLRSGDPVRAVFRDVGEAPVVPIEDDPRLKAAEAEARRRFSEFEIAFTKKLGSGFAVKALVSAPHNAEHIWIDVDSIAQGVIEGRLANAPVDLGDLKVGSQVKVDRASVEDWVFLQAGTPVGMFTVPVIQQINQERTKHK